MHLALFVALSLSSVNSLVSSWCDHSRIPSYTQSPSSVIMGPNVREKKEGEKMGSREEEKNGREGKGGRKEALPQTKIVHYTTDLDH